MTDPAPAATPPADWYTAGCARDCSTQHTYKLGRCALSTEDPPEPMVTISRVETMDDGAPGIVLRAVPASVWEALIKAAIRASRGRGAVFVPGPGAQGSPDASARRALEALHDAGLLPEPDAATCTWPGCLTDSQHRDLTEEVRLAELGESTTPMPDQRQTCGCTDTGGDGHRYRDMATAPLSPAGGLPARIVTAVETALGDELLPAARSDAIRRVEELLTPASDDGLREQITAALIEVRRDGMGGCTEAEACQRYAAAVLDVIRPRLAPDVEADNVQLRDRLDRIITHRNRLEAEVLILRAALAAETALRTERSDLYDTWRAKANEFDRQVSRARELADRLADPADTDPPAEPQRTDLASLRTWLATEAAHHRAAVPRCRYPEAAQAHDGIAAGLEIAGRAAESLAAGKELPVTGRETGVS